MAQSKTGRIEGLWLEADSTPALVSHFFGVFPRFSVQVATGRRIVF
jgi:hypothetical protein